MLGCCCPIVNFTKPVVDLTPHCLLELILLLLDTSFLSLNAHTVEEHSAVSLESEKFDFFFV